MKVNEDYSKVPKISPWANIFQMPSLRGLFLEGLIFGGAYLRREICVSKSIGLASLIVGSKFTVFALFHFVFESNFPSSSPPRAYIWRGDSTEGFLRYEFGGGGGPYYLEGLMHGIWIGQRLTSKRLK